MLKKGILRLAVAAFAIASALGFTALASAPAHASALPAHASLMAATAPSTAARPAVNPEKCGYGSSGGNIDTCIDVNHRGRHINYINVGALVVHREARIDVCLQRPRKSSLCSGFHTLRPHHGIEGSWDPNATEPAGNYCANTYLRTSHGTSRVGHECIDVS
jgi:hypothetical protein